MAFSLFWKTTSVKSWREDGITEVAKYVGPLEVRVWMESTLKMPEILK